MDVLYHITLRTSAALEQQREKLLQEDLEFGPDVDASREDDETDTVDNATDKMDVH